MAAGPGPGSVALNVVVTPRHPLLHWGSQGPRRPYRPGVFPAPFVDSADPCEPRGTSPAFTPFPGLCRHSLDESQWAAVELKFHRTLAVPKGFPRMPKCPVIKIDTILMEDLIYYEIKTKRAEKTACRGQARESAGSCCVCTTLSKDGVGPLPRVAEPAPR